MRTRQAKQAMPTNLRVHIAPVGFQFRRITEPLISMQADKAYLVSYGREDDAANFFKQIVKHLEDNYEHIKVEQVFLDIWDLYACIGKFHEIISSEKGNHMYVNVSTGTKITAIAGMLACMLWGATPYYARVSYPSTKESDTLQTEHVSEPDILPTYDINKPKAEFMLVLSLIKQAGGRIRKADLIQKLEELGIIRPRDESKKEFTESAKHSQLRAILRPMETEWNYVRVESSGRRSEVFMTDQGDAALRIFGVTKT